MSRYFNRARGESTMKDFARAGLMSIPPLLACIVCGSDKDAAHAASVLCVSCGVGI